MYMPNFSYSFFFNGHFDFDFYFSAIKDILVHAPWCTYIGYIIEVEFLINRVFVCLILLDVIKLF